MQKSGFRVDKIAIRDQKEEISFERETKKHFLTSLRLNGIEWPKSGEKYHSTSSFVHVCNGCIMDD